MTFRPLYEGSSLMCWWCPCCKSSLRTAEMIHADMEQRASERDISVAELRAESEKLIDKRPLSDDALAGLQKIAERREKEWKPVCEHDTNPWAGQRE